MRVAIVEDNESSKNLLLSYLKRYETENKTHIQTETFSDVIYFAKKQMTVNEMCSLIDTNGFFTMKNDKLGIKASNNSDGPQGFKMLTNGTDQR